MGRRNKPMAEGQEADKELPETEVVPEVGMPEPVIYNITRNFACGGHQYKKGDKCILTGECESFATKNGLVE